jgi:DNA-binding MarR family transcriptional regulator
MDTAPTRLRGKPSWLMKKVSLHAGRLLSESLDPLAAHPHHFALLAALEEYGPASQASLSARCSIDRSDTVAMVNELVEQSFVVRTPDPDDRRRNVITITDQGRQRVAQLDAVLREAQSELLAPLSPAERSQLTELLTRVLDHHSS